jgi:hypothetical protein
MHSFSKDISCGMGANQKSLGSVRQHAPVRVVNGCKFCLFVILDLKRKPRGELLSLKNSETIDPVVFRSRSCNHKRANNWIDKTEKAKPFSTFMSILSIDKLLFLLVFLHVRSLQTQQ